MLKFLPLIWAIILCCSRNGYSQQSDYYNNNYLRYEDHVYNKNIRSVRLHRDEWEFAPPIIRLNSEEKLRLLFDDLDAVVKNFKYTIVHCSATWQPSDRVMQSEYIKGFYDDPILDYSFSKNTIQPYVHYELLFPTENVMPAISGNYILKVYPEGDPDNPILTRRFLVAEERVNIITDIHRATIIEDQNHMQEVDFIIQTANYPIANPFQDLKVVIQQNDRWDNAIFGLQPLFVKSNELTYDHDHDNLFQAGNEFRQFDIKSLRWHSEFVNRIETDSLHRYHVWLYPGKSKAYFQYMSDRDINGHYKIDRQESSPSDKETESEYVFVHFTLKADHPAENGNVYVFGELTDWKYEQPYKMQYNEVNKSYEAVLYLKQGYYNYRYVFLEDGKKSADESWAEGSHYETENDYSIYVYYRPITSNYDMLIGTKRVNTFRQ